MGGEVVGGSCEAEFLSASRARVSELLAARDAEIARLKADCDALRESCNSKTRELDALRARPAPLDGREWADRIRRWYESEDFGDEMLAIAAEIEARGIAVQRHPVDQHIAEMCGDVDEERLERLVKEQGRLNLDVIANHIRRTGESIADLDARVKAMEHLVGEMDDRRREDTMAARTRLAALERGPASGCKVDVMLPEHALTGVIETIPCTDEARRSIEGTK